MDTEIHEDDEIDDDTSEEDSPDPRQMIQMMNSFL